ncbi:MAG: S46 family peptidase [Xanthomonadales bacterium]|nr:S46 family peptidase [Xanthomonadales bacterium]
MFAPMLAALLAASPVLALDGKWTPGQVREIDPAWLKDQGLELRPGQLWDAQRGTGLLAGTVNIAGCSGAFVSKRGLVLTNHHCLFPMLQEHSRPGRDLIRDGFLARKPEEELASASVRVEVPRRFRDVSAEILAAVPEGADAAARYTAIEARSRALVDACQQRPGSKCRVAVHDEGVQYVLIESFELRDVRLVYAPPRAVGEYGGEVDNWMWPRHTGDFAIARAWAGSDNAPADHATGNRPYQPEFHFPISTRGLAAGDFLMLLGYPGITWRALLAEEMRERRERFFPRRVDVFGEWIGILEQASAGDAAGTIAVAANLKGIANRHKNAQGQIAGLDRMGTLARQQAADDAVAAWAREQAQHQGALAAREALRALLAEREAGFERDFLLNLIPLGTEAPAGGVPPLPKALYFAATLAQNAREQAKADAVRAAGYTAADADKLRARLQREQANYFAPADQRIFAALVRRALALPEGLRIASLDARFAGKDAQAIAGEIAALYAGSRLLDASAREAMLGESVEALQAREDPLLALGFAWADDIAALRARERAWLARSAIHRPLWRRAVAAHAGQPVAPDANGTLRVGFAHVQGYSPRDGVVYTPFTRLSGVLEKHTGVEPFALPPALLAAMRDPGERWRDRALADVPVNFLADGDSSGGNSGSPMVNGRGELVGINFDRVWENVAGDFGFNPAYSRNISVDVRYLLWQLDRVEDAQTLLKELRVR